LLHVVAHRCATLRWHISKTSDLLDPNYLFNKCPVRMKSSHVSSSNRPCQFPNLPCQFPLTSRRKCYQFANIVTRRMTSHYNTDVAPDQKKLPRETNVSRHNMTPLKPLGSSQHYRIVGFKEGPQFGPP